MTSAVEHALEVRATALAQLPPQKGAASLTHFSLCLEMKWFSLHNAHLTASIAAR